MKSLPSGCHVPAPPGLARQGITWVLRSSAGRHRHFDPGFNFGLRRLPARSRHRETARGETLWILLHGDAEVTLDGKSTRVRRESVFEEGPWALSCAPGTRMEIRTGRAGSEWALATTANTRARGSHLYGPDRVDTEDRGAGLAQGACRRFVRTIFDHAARPDSAFVVGEVINRAGRWSSYPPHHHPQPEVYHYRFTRPQGYGHAEVGDHVFKVRHGDTTAIPGRLDHAQVSAPGYGMYYLWIVRHLPGRPYRGFEFTPEHTWLLNPRDQGWQPAKSR